MPDTQTHTVPAPQHAVETTDAPRLSWAGTVRSEWTKLLTLPSPRVLAITMLALSVLAAAVVAAANNNPGPSATATAVTGVSQAGQLFVAVIAVLFVTNEFASGQTRTTFVAVPKRLPVLAAKVVVAAVTAVVLTVVSVGAAWATALGVLMLRTGSAPLALPDVLATLGSTAAWLVVVAVFSVVVATIVRNAAGGVAVVLGILYIVPLALQIASALLQVDLTRPLLTTAGSTLDLIFAGAPWSGETGIGLLVLALWILVPTLVAGQLTTRRDV